MITAADILESRAWDAMMAQAETNIFEQFRLCPLNDMHRLAMLRLQLEALASLSAILRSQAATPNEANQ